MRPSKAPINRRSPKGKGINYAEKIQNTRFEAHLDSYDFYESSAVCTPDLKGSVGVRLDFPAVLSEFKSEVSAECRGAPRPARHTSPWFRLHFTNEKDAERIVAALRMAADNLEAVTDTARNSEHR